MTDERHPGDPTDEAVSGAVEGSVPGESVPGESVSGESVPEESSLPEVSEAAALPDGDAPQETLPIVPRQLPSAASFFGEPRPPRHSAHADPVRPASPVRWEDPPAPTTGVIYLGGESVGPLEPSVPVDRPEGDDLQLPQGQPPMPPVFRQTFVPVASPPQVEAGGSPSETEALAFGQAGSPGATEPPASDPQASPSDGFVTEAPSVEPPVTLPVGPRVETPPPIDVAPVASPPAAAHPQALDLTALRGSAPDDDTPDLADQPALPPRTMPVPQVPLDTDSLPTHDEQGETSTAAFGALFGSAPTAPVERPRSETSFTELISVPPTESTDSGQPTSFDWSSLLAPIPDHDEPEVTPRASDEEFVAAVEPAEVTLSPRGTGPIVEAPSGEPSAVDDEAATTEQGSPFNDESSPPTAIFVPPVETEALPSSPVEPEEDQSTDARPELTPWWLADRTRAAADAEPVGQVVEPVEQFAAPTDEMAAPPAGPTQPPAEAESEPGAADGDREATFTELLGIVPTPGSVEESTRADAAIESEPDLTPWSLTGDLSNDVVPPFDPDALPPVVLPPALPAETAWSDRPATLPVHPSTPAAPETAPIPVTPLAGDPSDGQWPAPEGQPASPVPEPDDVNPPTDPVVALFGADLFGGTETAEEPLPLPEPVDDEDRDSSWADEPRAPIPPALAGDAEEPAPTETPQAELPPTELPPTEAFDYNQAASDSEADVVDPATRIVPIASAPEAAAAEAAEAAAEGPELTPGSAEPPTQAFAQAAPADPGVVPSSSSAHSAPRGLPPLGPTASRRAVAAATEPPAALADWSPQSRPRDRPARETGTGGFSSLPPERRRLIAILIALGFVVVLVLLFILGRALVSHASSASDTSARITQSAAATPTPTPTPTHTAPPPVVAPGPAGPGTHAWSDLQGGECLSAYQNAWQQTYDVVACTTAHPAQMLHKGALTAAAGAAYPGDSALQSQVGLICSSATAINMTAAQAYTGVQISASYPTADQWSAGSRTYYCFASRTGGQTMTTSIAAAS